MSYSNLLIEDFGAVRKITVNRPDKLNALNSDTLRELDEAFAEVAADDSVRVAVLTGAGPKAFVAGADISEMNGLTPVEGRDFSKRGSDMMRRIETLNKPVIAMVNGFALGGGLELAMSCHLRIASDKAKIGQPEIKLGLVPGFGGSQRLLRLAGRAACLELCLVGDPISAQRGYELGVLNEIAAAEQLEERTMAIATQIANSAPLAARAILDCVVVGGESNMGDALSYESTQFGLIFSTEDMREGTSAFLEKRAAEFKGK